MSVGTQRLTSNDFVFKTLKSQLSSDRLGGAGIKLMTLGYNYKARGLSTTPWQLAVVHRLDSVHALGNVIFTRHISDFSKPH